MSTVELIKTIALAVIAVIIVIYFVVMAIKNGWIKKITETMNTAIRYAEDNISGPINKRDYVLKQVEDKCVELGIPYFLIKSIVMKLINTIISHHNIIAHKDAK